MRHSISVHTNNKKEDLILSAWNMQKEQNQNKQKIATESIVDQTQILQVLSVQPTFVLQLQNSSTKYIMQNMNHTFTKMGNSMDIFHT